MPGAPALLRSDSAAPNRRALSAPVCGAKQAGASLIERDVAALSDDLSARIEDDPHDDDPLEAKNLPGTLAYGACQGKERVAIG